LIKHIADCGVRAPALANTEGVPEPEHSRRSDVLLAACLALGVVATLAVTGVTLDRVRDEAAADTNTRLAAVGAEMEHQISGYAERLHGLRADFAHEPQLTRDDFSRLVDIDALMRRNPGAELVAFNRREGKRLVVRYLEPWDPKSSVLGMDINAEPTRRAAADFARSTGELAATRPITLMLPGRERGFLLLLAAYDESPVPLTAPARKRHFLGVLVAVFTADKMLQNSEQRAGIPFSLYDAGPTIESPRNRPRNEDWIAGKSRRGYTNYADIDVGGRRWRIVTDEPVPVRWTDPVATAAIGLALTTAFSGLFVSFVVSRRRAIKIAERMTEDLRAREAQLREAKEEAERANNAKSEFLSRMSHELRTPLTAILGFTELLTMSEVPAEQQRMFIDRTHKAGEHLLTLINDVLDISQIETGTLAISIEPVALGPVVDDVLALLGPLAASRGITIDNGIGGGDAVIADANRLRQVLVNLVSNAIKYNRDDGSVTLRSAVDDGHLLIEVSDTGRGIAPQDLPRMFEPFERLGIQTGEIEGSGIGLALSRTLAEQMGGSITAESELGHGSRFTVRLPLAASISVPPVRDAGAQGATDHIATVLCIEDTSSNRVLIESALSLRPGIQLLSAVRGSLGLDLARAHSPDVVLLDLNLPDMSGDDVLARLRAEPATADIPVIVISADATPRRVAALIEAGAFAFVTKPLAIRGFLETVDEALASTNHAGGA